MKKILWILIVVTMVMGAFGFIKTDLASADGLDQQVFLPLMMNNYDPSVTPVPICGYKEGTTDEGIETSIGIWIYGPAIVKPDLTEHQVDPFVLAVFPGAKYQTEFDSQIVWFYEGDADCLRSQYQYFEDYNIFEVLP